jgi:hypothetical protein
MDTTTPVDDSPGGLLAGWFAYTLNVVDEIIDARRYHPGGSLERELNEQLERAGSGLAEALGFVLHEKRRERKRKLASRRGQS